MLIISSNINAQQIGDYKPSLKKYGLGKMRKAPKKIFISTFNVHFEIYKEALDVKTASQGIRNTQKGKATARAAVGLEGIAPTDVQLSVDKLYQEYIDLLKEGGYEIISLEEASKTKAYEGWNRSDGPYIIESGLPGVLVAVPTDYSFMYKKETKKGKKSNGNFRFEVPKLSKELDGAIIAQVDLYLVYSDSKEPFFKGNAAKVKILTDYRLASTFSVTAPKEAKKIKGFGSIGIAGAESVTNVTTKVAFYQGKTGLGSEAAYEGGIKSDLAIEGIIKKQKVVAYQAQGTSTPTSFAPYYSGIDLADRFSKNTTWIPVDSKKFAEGLYMACKKLLTEQTNGFLSSVK